MFVHGFSRVPFISVVVLSTAVVESAFPFPLSTQTITVPKSLQDMIEAVFKSGALKQDPKNIIISKMCFRKALFDPGCIDRQITV